MMPQRLVGAENLCHLAGCSVDRRLLGSAPPARAWDDLRLVGLKLIFLVVTRAVSLLGLSRREWWWKDAECATRRWCAVRRWESKEVRDLLARLSQQPGGSWAQPDPGDAGEGGKQR